MYGPFKAADLVLWHGLDELGRLISDFETPPNLPTGQIVQPVFGHAAICVDPVQLVSADIQGVRKHLISEYLTDRTAALLVLRIKTITDVQRGQIAAQAMAFLGRPYGFGKIALQFGDNLLSRIAGAFTRRRQDVVFFRNLLRNEADPICSQVLAVSCWKGAGWTFCGINPDACQPSDPFADLVQRPGCYQVVYCHPSLTPYIPVGALHI